MDPSELAALIAAAQSGQSWAYDRLVDLYADRLFGYLYRLTASRVDSEDLLQEVFVRLVQAIGRYEHRDNFEAFLFRIATNLHHDRVRKLKRRGTTTSLDAATAERQSMVTQLPQAHADPPHAALEHSEDQAQLQLALAQLPDAERQVILLRHFTELSFKEIASTMGTPLGTALARAHRGLSRLRELVENPRQ